MGSDYLLNLKTKQKQVFLSLYFIVSEFMNSSGGKSDFTEQATSHLFFQRRLSSIDGLEVECSPRHSRQIISLTLEDRESWITQVKLYGNMLLLAFSETISALPGIHDPLCQHSKL